MSLRRAFALCVACLAGSASAAEPGPRATVATGVVEGAWVDGLMVFRGLRYAAPPVGPLRWQPPQPAPREPGVRTATTFGPACPQKVGLSLEGGGDPGVLAEDCLTLNVWTPRDAPPKPLPVMVWLHGGALIFGAGSLPLYDGAALAGRGAVVVTLNYRLGALGYFVHPALERAAPGGPANFGLLDQIAALEWVRDNIAAFGGDPAQVTVFGQSAGAQSVLALMASPPARGLFHRAIAESPYGLPSHPRTKARQSGVQTATALGLPGAEATADALRAVPAERFAALAGPGLSLAPSLIVGDRALPRPILETFAARGEARVPLVIGSNSDDSSVALAFGLQPAALVERLGKARVLLKPLYPDVVDPGELGRQVVRDVAFTVFARRIAVLHARQAPTWRYWFDALPSAQRADLPGSPHGGEVTAVFGTAASCGCLSVLPDADDARAGQALADRWLAFARNGDPAIADGPAWPADRLYRPVVLEFGRAQTVRPRFMADRLNALVVGLRLLGRTTPD